MALLGQAALAMWWDMARLGVPGFMRSSRWTDAAGGDGIFVLYELESHAVLASPEYLARLNAPTPWSTSLMPHHRNMVRTQNHVIESRGAAIARHALTLRLALAGGRAGDLREGIKSLIDQVAGAPGISGSHLLRHEAPDVPQTTEQKIRGTADRVAGHPLRYSLRASLLISCGGVVQPM